MKSKKCSKNIVFDGDKMKRLAKHRWPMLGAKGTFGKVLEERLLRQSDTQITFSYIRMIRDIQ